jgi:hypothetical protein
MLVIAIDGLTDGWLRISMNYSFYVPYISESYSKVYIIKGVKTRQCKLEHISLTCFSQNGQTFGSNNLGNAKIALEMIHFALCGSPKH